MTLDMSARSHGFVFPPGLPPCSTCGLSANDPSHVNPAKGGVNLFMGSALGGMRIVSADTASLAVERKMPTVRRSHAYSSGVTSFRNLLCVACRQPMGASAHTAGMPSGMGLPQMAAEEPPVEEPVVEQAEITLRQHAYTELDEATATCGLCGYGHQDEVHAQAEEPGTVTKQVARFVVAEPNDSRDAANARSQGLPTQQAFVTQVNGKLLITGRADVFTEPDDLMPRELAAAWERASAQNPYFMWIEGRFVEADRPNRNKAAWSSADLEMAEPSVAHGPINWLHDERHIIGAIAAAKLITVSDADRQAASDAGRDPVNNHIRALSPIWRYLYPQEARQIAAASDSRNLWFSMECYSREVACLAPGCSHVQSYGDYMSRPMTRCQHVKEGGNRRFADPTFTGGAVILPPFRPGWGGAHASVMRQAAALAEEQQAAFDGLTTSEAELVVAQTIAFAGGTHA